GPPPPPGGRPPPPRRPARPPGPARGQAAALRQRLWQAQTAEPAHAATLALLQSCADRFDFQTLIEYLRDTAELTEDDTPL
ncbi:MAG: hypothetical protein ACK4NM_13295, partial [Hydrogenophaga sp.]